MRTALVTGASRGIGRGIAFELAERGFGLTVTARNGVDLERLAGELLEAGAARVVHLPLDLADRDAVPGLVDLHRATFATMDALILSGGVGTAGPLEDLPLHRLDKTFEVNVASAVLLTQRSLPLLRRAAADQPAHGARVVALASITGVYAEPGLAVYGASKAALISLMETLNAEESHRGVLATAVAPAYVATDMSAWTTDTIPAETMIPVADVVRMVGALLDLGPTTSITSLVLSRSGTDGHRA